jgi:hypothetical protein
MKNIILIVIAFSFISLSVKGQDDRDKFKFGVKIGSNYSNVYDSEGDQFEADGKFGFAAGTFLCIPLAPMIGLQPEFLFSQKGFKATGTLLGGGYQFTRTTSYIDVPIFLSLKPVTFITLLAGPQYSYLLQQKDVFGVGSSTIEQETVFMNDDIRKNTIGFVIGGDINIDHYVFSGRIGFDLFKNNGDGTSSTPRYKNTWIQATVGYKFFVD